MNINEKHFSIGDITIINDDCLKYLETLEDNSIDCCITDPPYFIDKLDDSWDSKKVTERKNNSHIKHLPKGMKFDKKQVVNLHNFYSKLGKILIKKMKPSGFFLSFLSFLSFFSTFSFSSISFLKFFFSSFISCHSNGV